MDGDTYISPEMVVELDKSKLFEIGVHTKTHVKLGTLDYDTQYNEIIESKNTLEKLLNKKIHATKYSNHPHPQVKKLRLTPQLVSHSSFSFPLQ